MYNIKLTQNSGVSYPSDLQNLSKDEAKSQLDLLAQKSPHDKFEVDIQGWDVICLNYPNGDFDLFEIEEKEDYRKDKQGLYLNGEFKADNYSDAIRELYQLNEIPNGFSVNEDHEANGYSVIDSNGVQHIYELSTKEFYKAFMQLD